MEWNIKCVAAVVVDAAVAVEGISAVFLYDVNI